MEDEQDSTFKYFIQAISNQLSLAMADSVKMLYLFTSASSTNSTGVITKVNPLEISKVVSTSQ